MKFEYEFEDNPRFSDLSIDLDDVKEANVKIKIMDGNKIWITAPAKGWLELAKVFVELGTRDLEAGYHFHRDFDFGWSDGAGPEISFQVVK